MPGNWNVWKQLLFVSLASVFEILSSTKFSDTGIEVLTKFKAFLHFCKYKTTFSLQTQKLSDLTMKHIGQTATLTCELNVTSARQVWFHNGQRIVPCRDYKISRGTDKTTERTHGMLIIDYVTEENIGVYTCVATNRAGFVSTSCYLTIVYGMLKVIDLVLEKNVKEYSCFLIEYFEEPLSVLSRS